MAKLLKEHSRHINNINFFILSLPFKIKIIYYIIQFLFCQI
nr:MAG TPA: hypothetical protein [Ackermannviridae sp.]